jgi:3-hydroxyacyl-CoA dehydrogenase/enoyl-CoA hydratase/3-hydroxybutyryl-CoA epimerase
MHFFNPAHVMKLVEIIPGLPTSPETVDDVIAFSESLRKIPVRVQDCPGFLVNRLLMPYLNEAALTLQESPATAKQIDEAMVAFGMPMGPFALLDMIGIDVSDKVARILHDAYGPRMTPAVILEELVKSKRFGSKNGLGFYNYQGAKDETLDRLVARVQKAAGSKKTRFSPERLLLILINEAVFCLQEGVASAGDIDISMVAGTGFPQEKGGPLHLADHMGIDVVLQGLETFKQELGNRFWPAPMLKLMVAAGYLGKKSGRGFFTY